MTASQFGTHSGLHTSKGTVSRVIRAVPERSRRLAILFLVLGLLGAAVDAGLDRFNAVDIVLAPCEHGRPQLLIPVLDLSSSVIDSGGADPRGRSFTEAVDVVEHMAADPCTACLLYTSPSPRDQRGARMPSSA